jgi:hypothetical protein
MIIRDVLGIFLSPFFLLQHLFGCSNPIISDIKNCQVLFTCPYFPSSIIYLSLFPSCLFYAFLFLRVSRSDGYTQLGEISFQKGLYESTPPLLTFRMRTRQKRSWKPAPDPKTHLLIRSYFIQRKSV